MYINVLVFITYKTTEHDVYPSPYFEESSTLDVTHNTCLVLITRRAPKQVVTPSPYFEAETSFLRHLCTFYRFPFTVFWGNGVWKHPFLYIIRWVGKPPFWGCPCKWGLNTPFRYKSQWGCIDRWYEQYMLRHTTTTPSTARARARDSRGLVVSWLGRVVSR
jgi:hypothetical protein